MISFADRATVPANVLIRFLDQESVLLNLNTEKYFGLDSVGTRMWQLLTSAPTIDSAYSQLIDEYDVDPETLRSNLSDLLNHLVENGLIATQPADVGTIRRFSALPRPAKALVLRVVALLPLLTISLRMRGFGATQRFLRRFIAPSEDRSPLASAVDSRVALTSRVVLAAARNSFVPSTCLERSIALWWLLARQGIVTQLRIGVRKDQGKLAAHAWVEYQGNAIGEPEASHLHYAAFAEEMGELS